MKNFLRIVKSLVMINIFHLHSQSFLMQLPKVILGEAQANYLFSDGLDGVLLMLGQGVTFDNLK